MAAKAGHGDRKRSEPEPAWSDGHHFIYVTKAVDNPTQTERVNGCVYALAMSRFQLL